MKILNFDKKANPFLVSGVFVSLAINVKAVKNSLHKALANLEGFLYFEVTNFKRK